MTIDSLGPPVADRTQIETFIDRLFRYADDGGYVQLRAFRDDVDGAWESERWSAIPLKGADRTALVDAAHDFANECAKAPFPVVFAPPVITLAGPKTAAEIDVANGVVLSVECDRNPNSARKKLEALLGPATVVIESGGEWTNPETGEVQRRLHLHWRLTEPSRCKADHALLKEARRLATSLVGADGSAVPLVHPMRWPGSLHRKDPTHPRLARIVHDASEAEIDLGEAIDRLREACATAKVNLLTPSALAIGDGRSSKVMPFGTGGVQIDRDRDRRLQTHQSSEPLADDPRDVFGALSIIPNGDLDWDDWNRIGMAVWRATGGSETGFAAFVCWSAKSGKYDPVETRKRWDHYRNNPPTQIGAGTLFYEARKVRPLWQKPSDFGKWGDAGNDNYSRPSDPTAPPEIADRTGPVRSGEAVRLIHFRDMKPRTEDRGLVKGLLNNGEISLCVGASGTAKTFLAIDLGLHVARGADWFGRSTREMGVVYIAAEAGAGIINRVAAHKVAYPDLPADLPFAAITSPVNLRDPNADMMPVLRAIRTADLAQPLGLVVVDTLSRAMGGGDENSSEDMGDFVGNMDKLRASTGAHILIVHHLGKDASRGARGHSLLHAAVDTEILITRDEATAVSTAAVVKQRDLPIQGRIGYRLRVVELGRDQNDEPVTSCVIEDAEPSTTRRKEPTGKAKLALDQLRNCIACDGVELAASRHVPVAVTGVTLALWKRYLFAAALLNNEGNPRQQFSRIRVTLQRGGYIGIWDDFVWLSHPVTGASQ